MSDAREATIRALDWLGDNLGRVGRIGGLKGLGITGAAAVLRTTAEVMRSRDEDVDDILQRIRAPRDLQMPWDERTPAERPSGKKERP